MFGDEAERAIGIVVGARNERAVDVELVVALAEEEVHHLECRMAAVGQEDLLGRIAWEGRILRQHDRAIADATRILAALTKWMRAAELGGEVEPRQVHVEAGERRRR